MITNAIGKIAENIEIMIPNPTAGPLNIAPNKNKVPKTGKHCPITYSIKPDFFNFHIRIAPIKQSALATIKMTVGIRT